jgi:1-pyrroline-4-hydroxy-2-carboxylate deaminase
VDFALAAQEIGVDGLMLLPAMVYVPTPAELLHHLRAVADAVKRPADHALQQPAGLSGQHRL